MSQTPTRERLRQGACRALAVVFLFAVLWHTTPAAESVDVFSQVQPILRRACAKCHAGTRRKGEFSINDRQSVINGGESGPAVVVGHAEESPLIESVTEDDPDLRMPQEAPPLSKEQIRVLRDWIDAGLPWEKGFVFGRPHRKASVEPRRPELPEVPGTNHPIDRLLHDDLGRSGDRPAPIVSDPIFARRVYLDLVGLLPTPEQLATFTGDSSPDKRAGLVASLLADRRAYAEHWLTFWNDLLRNAYRGTGFIDNGRSQITGWLYRSLYENKPYDRMVHELIHPVPGSEGFIRGIKWRGTVNDSQRREIQAAQNIAQVMLGTNLKCASCHDSFVNSWKVADTYSLASVFADGPLEIHRCNRPTGTMAVARFIFPELGSIDPGASYDERTKQLADLIVQSADGRLARTIVNRLWAQLLGRGIVEPLDDMDAVPWNQDLLDWLASDLVDHGYDLKRTLRLIATSGAYQAPSVGQALPDEPGHGPFRGPLVKRMTAEEFIDALATVTHCWPEPTGAMLRRDGRRQGGQLADVAALIGYKPLAMAPSRAKWIWGDAQAIEAPAGQTVWMRKTIMVAGPPVRVLGAFTADNRFTLYVNGHRAAASDRWMTPVQIDLTEWIHAGANVLAAEAANGGTAPNPAGFIGDVAILDEADKVVARIGTDASWRTSQKTEDRWQQPALDDTSWAPAVEVAGAGSAPWAIADRIVPAAKPALALRNVLFMDDPLNRALGRPNRDQVVTRRESLATTLQAMELTNGATLDKLLRTCATRCIERGTTLDRIFLAALGREPTGPERRIAANLVGRPVTPDGMADLLWSILMLPEFQLVP